MTPLKAAFRAVLRSICHADTEQAEKSVSREGALQTENDRETGSVISRRFGSEHEKPCADPNVLTCAKYECQRANRCMLNVREAE